MVRVSGVLFEVPASADVVKKDVATPSSVCSEQPLLTTAFHWMNDMI